jgi:hypothetical protein
MLEADNQTQINQYLKGEIRSKAIGFNSATLEKL